MKVSCVPKHFGLTPKWPDLACESAVDNRCREYAFVRLKESQLVFLAESLRAELAQLFGQELFAKAWALACRNSDACPILAAPGPSAMEFASLSERRGQHDETAVRGPEHRPHHGEEPVFASRGFVHHGELDRGITSDGLALTAAWQRNDAAAVTQLGPQQYSAVSWGRPRAWCDISSGVGTARRFAVGMDSTADQTARLKDRN